MKTDDTLFLGSNGSPRTLSEISRVVFDALGLSENKERLSSNYPPDMHYFVGFARNLQVTVYDADDEVMPDYPFRITLGGPVLRQGPSEIDAASSAIAAKIALAGVEVFVPHGAWYQPGWQVRGERHSV